VTKKILFCEEKKIESKKQNNTTVATSKHIHSTVGTHFSKKKRYKMVSDL
jgi:hypothetical protein